MTKSFVKSKFEMNGLCPIDQERSEERGPENIGTRPFKPLACFALSLWAFGLLAGQPTASK